MNLASRKAVSFYNSLPPKTRKPKKKITRNRSIKTVKPSPLSNRSVHRTCGLPVMLGQHSERVPEQKDGWPFQGRYTVGASAGGTTHPRLLSGDRDAVLLVVSLRIIIKRICISSRNVVALQRLSRVKDPFERYFIPRRRTMVRRRGMIVCRRRTAIRRATTGK